jgi:hypothetical protein
MEPKYAIIARRKRRILDHKRKQKCKANICMVRTSKQLCGEINKENKIPAQTLVQLGN